MTEGAKTVDDVIFDLAYSAGELPRASIAWSLERWDEARPRFLGLLERRADGGELTDEEEDALFLIIHILAEKRETAAFAPLVRLMMEPPVMGETFLGDAVTETFPGVLISTFDGRQDVLLQLIEAPEADEFARAAALDVLVHLARTGAVDPDEPRAYLKRLRTEMQPRGWSYLWTAWAIAASRLGYEDLRPDVEALIKEGWIGRRDLTMRDFDEDLAKANRGEASLFDREPFTSTIETFAKWHYYTPAYLHEVAGDLPDDLDEDEDGLPMLRAEDPSTYGHYAPSEPVRNPYRDVGRNDPCPCGSGKKFKKCCLDTAR